MFFWYNLCMTNCINNQHHYSVFQPHMLLQMPKNFNLIDKDDIFYTALEIVEGVNINDFINFKKQRCDSYDKFKLFSALVLSICIHGKLESLRNLESEFRYDIRFQYILNYETPSYKTIQRFINEDLSITLDELFKRINLYIADNSTIKRDILYIDGTKFEAYANKMTFVWKKSTDKFFARCWAKVINAIQKLNKYFESKDIDIKYTILKEANFIYLLKITDKIEDYAKSIKLQFVYGKGKRKTELQKIYEEFADYAMKMFKYEIHYDLFRGRNSFSKTDPDAGFLHMKYDYYNHTNVFKPGYNVQMGVMDGFIMSIFINTDANDLNSFQQTVEKYKELYGEYPRKICADAGYGSRKNYAYCEQKDIKAFIKYPTYEKELERRTEKNKFRSVQFEKDENHIPICPAGHTFVVEKISVKTTEYNVPETVIKARCQNCKECPMRNRCTKSKYGRSMEINLMYEKQKSNVRTLLSSEEGKEALRNRSIQAEGAFGVLKENYGFDRLSRRGETGVRIEIYSASIGHNIRKFHKAKVKARHEEERKKLSEKIIH